MARARPFDLNLLTVFEAVFETGSITAAADRLGLTQSAVSHAIGRLRGALSDELFVRSGNALKPTVTATSLYPSFRESLDSVRAAVTGKALFDPQRSRREFRIAIPHIAGPIIGLRIEARVAREAPDVRLSFDTRTMPAGVLREMEEGRVDMAIDWLRIAEGRFVHQHIFDDRLTLLYSSRHPRLGEKASLKDIEAERFVTHYGRTASWVEPLALRQLRDLITRRKWNVAFHVSELLEIPLVVGATPLVGAVPRSIAGALMETGLLRTLALPAAIAAFPVTLSWHSGRRHDPAHTWLRRLVRSEVKHFGDRGLTVLADRASSAAPSSTSEKPRRRPVLSRTPATMQSPSLR